MAKPILAFIEEERRRDISHGSLITPARAQSRSRPAARRPRGYFRTIRLNRARAFGSYGSVANRYGRACIRATTSSSPGKT